MLERKTISAQGILLSYLSDPAGKKGTLVFLHGWRSSASVWQEVLLACAQEGFAVYALDMPGFGSSGNPPRAFTVDDYALVVKEWMEKIGIPNASVIGHSFGGRIGIVLASRHTASVSKLVLVDSAGIRNPSVRRQLIGFFAKCTKPIFAFRFMNPVRRGLYRALGAGDYLATPELVETFKLVIEEDLQPLLPKISQDTLLVWGEYDTDTPISFAVAMEKQIPRAELKILTGAKHFSFLDAPEQFIDLLKAFLP